MKFNIKEFIKMLCDKNNKKIKFLKKCLVLDIIRILILNRFNF